MLPSWLITYLMLTALVHIGQGFTCGSDTLSPDDSVTGVIPTIIQYATFTGCDGIPTWFSVALFTVFTLPWLMIAISYIFQLVAPLLSNPVVGIIVGVALSVALVAFIVIVLTGVL
jgi:hypothetical protein